MTPIKKSLRLTLVAATTFATLAAGFTVQPVLAAGHHENPGYRLLGQTALTKVHATDQFLRQDKQGRKYLCVVYAENALSVLNATNTAQITETSRLALTTTEPTAHAQQVNADFIVFSNTPQPEQDVRVSAALMSAGLLQACRSNSISNRDDFQRNRALEVKDD
jgi:hypothetical protein